MRSALLITGALRSSSATRIRIDNGMELQSGDVASLRCRLIAGPLPPIASPLNYNYAPMSFAMKRAPEAATRRVRPTADNHSLVVANGAVKPLQERITMKFARIIPLLLIGVALAGCQSTPVTGR